MKLLVLDEIVAMIARVHGLAKRVARHDKDLASQMRRSSTSVGLNGAEGLRAHGGNRTSRLDSAMCSGRETILALRIAGACGYLPQTTVDVEVDAVDRVVAILFKLSRR